MKPLRVAMWSGPRNISTAMMRSWENRNDTIVTDEPLYGPYLSQTKKQHPMYQEIIEHQGSDYQLIINHLISDKLPLNKSIYYQKHMSHHLLDLHNLSWTKKLINVFLIRDPQYVLASYLRKHENPTPEDLGYPQQVKLFNYLQTETKDIPLVLESKDILKNPKSMMKLLCARLGIDFDHKMLTWPKGYRDTDGIWASHWYNRVIESTGFAKYHPKELNLTDKQKSLAEKCMPYYQSLSEFKLRLE
jgi:hypothetical protein